MAVLSWRLLALGLRNFQLKKVTKVNHQISASELRIIGPQGEILGVMNLSDALRKAAEFEMDLIEIAPTATPPVAKIADYGKFKYEANKKERESRTKVRDVDTKAIQITIGTGNHDLELKAKRASEWLKEGHRIKIDLFLRGRAKYMDKKFLTDRLERILKLIPDNHKIVEPPQKSPKGLSMTIEKA